MDIIISSISQGILWSILSIGLFISFRILNMADMTIEGSFPLGAAVSVVLILSGFNPYLAILFSFFIGLLSGLITALLINYCKIPSLLAGILTMTALLSINLRIMGRPNISLLNVSTIFDVFKDYSMPKHYDTIFIGLILTFILILFVFQFFKTEIGQAVIATGDNEKMATSLGISTKHMLTLGLMLSNGIVSLSGAIISQYQGFVDINSGIGIIVVALAAIIIGEVLFSNVKFIVRLVCIILGAIAYRLLILIVLEINIVSPNDFKLISSIIIVLFLSLPKFKNNFLK